LISVDEPPDLLLETNRESLAERLDAAVLQGHGAERAWRQQALRLGQEQDMRVVDALQVQSAGMEFFE
jgi:hypothetical protein